MFSFDGPKRKPAKIDNFDLSDLDKKINTFLYENSQMFQRLASTNLSKYLTWKKLINHT